ncbi:unnamed protein product [Pieris macdunnoughi]|uniref:Uncharacterized protein n=1 Tax=Pieris macdunnoughi TaxID=345717 RepID=A0A821WY30_9NEOP|nr:unnamed protein product [Pieris macdunnoughi]
MFRFYILCFLFVFEGHSADIESTLKNYFNSDKYTAFQKDWQKHRKSYENAIKLALKDNYGYKGMNVYIRKSADAHRIANGFYLSDGVVGVMFHEMFLGELPHLSAPEVTFALASNILRIESGIDKILIHTRYTLFRNQSDVIYGNPDDKNSPFTYDVVDNLGNAAIIAENCKLTGYAITKLSGQSVDIGHSTFAVTECKFSIEISSPGLGREPITAQYFNQPQSKSLEKLISKPIREEMLPKLQATLLTYINTTLIFQERLSEYRKSQRKMFKESSKYILKLIRSLNKQSIQLNKAATGLQPYHITWNVCVEKACPIHVGVNDVTVYGLDSVFSAHRGGPFKLQSLKIGEALTFNYVQVRGKVHFENETIKFTHNFFAEIDDVTFAIEMGFSNQVQDSHFVDWRSIELSIMDFKGNIEERMNANSFITGYLYNEIPKALTEYLHGVLGVNPKPAKLIDLYSSWSREKDDQEENTEEISSDQSVIGKKMYKTDKAKRKKPLLLSLNKHHDNGHISVGSDNRDEETSLDDDTLNYKKS